MKRTNVIFLNDTTYVYRYSNIHVDLESLRPPPQQMFIHAAANSLPLRTQLTQVLHISVKVHVPYIIIG